MHNLQAIHSAQHRVIQSTMVTRAPCAALKPFLDVLWASTGSAESGFRHQQVLPTGMAHIVLRLGESPVCILKNPDDPKGMSIGSSIIGGVRATAYFKDVETHSPSVGMLLRPGALELVSQAPASVFAGAHTSLNLVWGTSTVTEILDRLSRARSPALMLDVIEHFLMLRLPRTRGIHPVVAHALKRFNADAKVADVVSETGLSHRHFIKIFAATVGLTPKLYRRVQRFNHVLSFNKTNRHASWAEIAAESGFADQAHLNREFSAFAGISPSSYRQLSVGSTHHLPVEVKIVQDNQEHLNRYCRSQ